MDPLLTRRTALLTGAVWAAGAAGAAAVSTGGVAAAAGFPALKSVRAADFIDSVGVQTHLSYTNTPYADVGAVVAALRDLAIRHVRDDLRLDRPALYDAFNQLAAAGIGVDLIMGAPGDAPASAYVSVVAGLLSRVESVEGTNEWDLSGHPNWPAEVHQRQSDLFAAMRADPRTAGIPVLAPALAYLTNLPQLTAVGPLAAVSDVANAHAYGGGKPMPPVVGGVRAVMAQQQPGQPIVISESGYTNALKGPPGQPAVTEAVAATYVPRLFLDCFTGGISRTYDYELLDEFADPGLGDIESHFGLLRHDLSPKPAYSSLRTLLRLAEDSGSSAPPPLRVGARGPSDLRHLLLAKRDGTHLLVLWRDVTIYARHEPQRVRAVPVRLAFPGALPVRVYRPVVSSVPVASLRTREVTVPVGGDIAVLAIGHARSDFRRPLVPDAPAGIAARRSGGGVRVSWRRPAYRTAVSWQVRVGGRTTSVPGEQRSALVHASAASVQVRAVGAGRTSAWVSAKVKG